MPRQRRPRRPFRARGALRLGPSPNTIDCVRCAGCVAGYCADDGCRRFSMVRFHHCDAPARPLAPLPARLTARLTTSCPPARAVTDIPRRRLRTAHRTGGARTSTCTGGVIVVVVPLHELDVAQVRVIERRDLSQRLLHDWAALGPHQERAHVARVVVVRVMAD